MSAGKRHGKSTIALKGGDDMKQIKDPDIMNYKGACSSCGGIFMAYRGELHEEYIPVRCTPSETIVRIELQAPCPVCSAIIVFEKEV